MNTCLGSVAIPLGSKQVVSSEELVRSQVVSNEVIIRLHIKKGIFTKEEFLEMGEKVNLEMRKMA